MAKKRKRERDWKFVHGEGEFYSPKGRVYCPDCWEEIYEYLRVYAYDKGKAEEFRVASRPARVGNLKCRKCRKER